VSKRACSQFIFFYFRDNTMEPKTDGVTATSLLGGGGGFSSSSSYPLSRQSRVILTVMGFVTVASGMAIGLSRIGLLPSSSISNTAITAKTTHHQYRVFAFGDSLTAGYVQDSSKLYPYANALRETLEPLLLADTTDDSSTVTVDHEGRPGWTSAALYEILPDDLPYDVMIILAGTNDLGMGLSAATIGSHLQDLHVAALRRGVGRTMAIEIPPSAYQQHYADARELASAINHAMKEWNDPRITVVPFPFPYDSQDQRWHQDGLHLTEAGYNALGQYLAPLVLRALQQQVAR
jgi:lysophospholipase L1-like esterase